MIIKRVNAIYTSNVGAGNVVEGSRVSGRAVAAAGVSATTIDYDNSTQVFHVFVDESAL